MKLNILNKRYELLKVIGQGGMGKVHLAKDKQKNNRKVAVKEIILSRANDQSKERFRREYYFLSTIEHPNVVKAYDFFEEKDVCYMVMEWVSGISLQDFIKTKSGVISSIEQIAIAIQIARAIEVINTAGIIHRDIKPGNIIVDEKNRLIKILDLGIAKSFEHNLQTLTAPKSFMGTPAYISPEQIDGTTTRNSDVFPLGIVLYQLFLWLPQSPFHSGTMIATFGAICERKIPSIMEKMPDVPHKNIYQNLSQIVEECLEKKHSLRTKSCAEVTLKLQEAYEKLLSNTQDTQITGWQPTSLKRQQIEILKELESKYRNLRSRRIKQKQQQKPPYKKILSITGILLVTVILFSFFSGSISQGTDSINREDVAQEDLSSKQPNEDMNRITETKPTETLENNSFYKEQDGSVKEESKDSPTKESPTKNSEETLTEETGENDKLQGKPLDVMETSISKDNKINKTGEKVFREEDKTPKKVEISPRKKYKAVLKGFKYGKEREYSCAGIRHRVMRFLHKKTDIRFVLVPGGIFFRKGQRITLDPFLMSKYEVRQREWAKVMKSRPSFFKGSRRPVDSVSWYEAKEFCKKTKFELPTEAQWEYACRAGQESDYYWGSEKSDAYMWYAKNSGKKSQNTGQKLPNAFGLFDMSGNVFEWCEDSYAKYPKKDALNPVNISKSLVKVIRGGAWPFTLELGKCGERKKCLAKDKEKFRGFRVVKNLSQMPFYRELNTKLERMREDFAQIPMESDDTIDLIKKFERWNIFMRNFAEDNPYTTEDDYFRKEIATYLEKNKEKLKKRKKLTHLSSAEANAEVRRKISSRTNDEDLVFITSYPTLSELDLVSTRVTDKGLRHLLKLPNLSSVKLNDRIITDKGCLFLKKCKNLHTLALDATKITDEGLRHLSNLKKLKYFSIPGTKVSGKGFVYLKQLTELVNLDLRYINFKPEDLKNLTVLTSLRILNLAGSSINDDGLRYLKDMENIESLHLYETKIGDKGAMYLKSLTGLRDLPIYGTNISDAGLIHLESLKQLEYILIHGTKATQAGIDRLKKALPSTNIEQE
ncbi:protein kinase domain-containing protein [Candidatus Uabimicrobium amorphum]|uniref:non-specific serine/threonine protein kinase n=1 Tax=Uabimicrobium amorphum TaxID=2596890 RepID=A0A5S9F1F1_UABAM|nr:protein kinase [Candidatus Uabimicrobium amorphum]BBM82506.1 serine/threonine-protein kinase PrkC [Candidatus Uabimicrobium amorphum]